MIDFILLCLILPVHSRIANIEAVSMIESGISRLNQTDFSRPSDQSFFHSFHYNLTRGNFSENTKLLQLFSHSGEIKVLNAWFDRLMWCNSKGDGENTLLLKSFSGRAVWLVTNGVYYSQFYHEELIEKVISFILTPVLFLDSDFTTDMFTAGVDIVNYVQRYSRSFGLKSILKRLLVSQRSTIDISSSNPS